MPIGTSKVGALGGLVPGGTETFNTSGTFSVPPGVKKISVEGTGGTGAPGNSGNPGNAGNPGGGGGGGGAATGLNCPQFNSQFPYVASTNTQPQWPDPGGPPSGSRRRGGLGGGGALGGVSGSVGPGAAGSAGTGGSAGNPGNSGQCGQTTTAFCYNFAGGNAGTGGNGGTAGTGGAAGNGGVGQSFAPPANPRAGGTQGGGSGGGGGFTTGNVPAYFVTYKFGSGGGGAGATNNGGNAPQAIPSNNQIGPISNPGAGGTPGGGSGGKGRYYGYFVPTQQATPGSCPLNPPFVCIPFSSKGNPANQSVTRAGGGGAGGTGSSTGDQAGGGGGGRGAAGNCGGAGNPGNPGNAGTNATYNCVPVTPGGCYPIVVGGPSGGSVVISWNPQ